tara:strand:+ start:196 stop:564 length:369 start_codon:yes stop_codon:yes gene_type:complete
MVIPIEFYTGINAENTVEAANNYLEILKRTKRNYGWDEFKGDITASLNLGTPNLSAGARIYKFAYDCLSEVLNETGKDENTKMVIEHCNCFDRFILPRIRGIGPTKLVSCNEHFGLYEALKD